MTPFVFHRNKMLNIRNSGFKFAVLSKAGFDLYRTIRTFPAVFQIHHKRNLHEIPEKLAEIPVAENPRFFDMVEYFFHKACQIAADKLVEDIKTKMSIEDKKKKLKEF